MSSFFPGGSIFWAKHDGWHSMKLAYRCFHKPIYWLVVVSSVRRRLLHSTWRTGGTASPCRSGLYLGVERAWEVWSDVPRGCSLHNTYVRRPPSCICPFSDLTRKYLILLYRQQRQHLETAWTHACVCPCHSMMLYVTMCIGLVSWNMAQTRKSLLFFTSMIFPALDPMKASIHGQMVCFPLPSGKLT